MYSRVADFFQKRERAFFILQGVILVLYVLLRVTTTVSALNAPRELADTDIYARISTQPILGPGFLEVDRPFVFPMLLQIVRQDYGTAAIIQLALTILAWGLLAYFVSSSFQPVWLRLFSFLIVLALSLVRHLAGWDFVMMTESLSLSSFVFLIASAVWLLRGWRADKVVVLFVIAFIFAFTRDTNAYLLAMFAGLILFAVLFRWAMPNALIVAAGFMLIFLISNLSADTSERWMFPLVNVVGKRILPYAASVKSFESCGMPVTPELLGLADSFANGQDRAFFNDPALEGFRTWVRERGKSCYARWLLANPVQTVGAALGEFDGLIYFEDVGKYFSRRYADILPSQAERLLYPVYYITWLWILLTIAALIAIVRRAWRNNILWAVFILLALTIFPHLFITWHGDAMAPHRHAVSVGLQLALTTWLLILLIIEQFDSQLAWEKQRT